MATKHLGILNAMAAAVALAVGAGVKVTKGDTRPVSGELASKVNLNLVSSSQIAGLTMTRTNWQTLVDVEIYGKGTGATDAMAAVDGLLQTVFNGLLADNTLGGLALDVNPADGETVRWDLDEQAERLCRATARFLVLHQSTDRSIS